MERQHLHNRWHLDINSYNHHWRSNIVQLHIKATPINQANTHWTPKYWCETRKRHNSRPHWYATSTLHARLVRTMTHRTISDVRKLTQEETGNSPVQIYRIHHKEHLWSGNTRITTASTILRAKVWDLIRGYLALLSREALDKVVDTDQVDSQHLFLDSTHKRIPYNTAQPTALSLT
jgi:hypothetical protein